uniref:Uncharacterized protein n=1 Tax=Glossina austeni TaxID=7395 RepID=A0A1A9V3S8_GLOAU
MKIINTIQPLPYEYTGISMAKPILRQRLMMLSALDTGSSRVTIGVLGDMLLIMRTQDLKTAGDLFFNFNRVNSKVIILIDGHNIKENEALLLLDFGIASGNVLKSLSTWLKYKFHSTNGTSFSLAQKVNSYRFFRVDIIKNKKKKRKGGRDFLFVNIELPPITRKKSDMLLQIKFWKLLPLWQQMDNQRLKEV